MNTNSPVLAPFDPERALALLDHDGELLTVIFESFQEDCPRMLAVMQHAVDNRDAGALKRAAHDFKGAVSNFSERNTIDLAFALELMGDRGALADASATLSHLRIAVQRLGSVLGDYLVRLPARAS